MYFCENDNNRKKNSFKHLLPFLVFNTNTVGIQDKTPAKFYMVKTVKRDNDWFTKY